MLPARNQSAFSNTQPSLRVARWCRVSTEEQSKEGRAGLQRQYDQTDRIIATHGYELIESFEVIAVSGASIMHAPEFQRLIRLVQSGTIHAVVVAEMSRLMRVDSWEGMAVLDVFARHEVHIIADGMDIDFSNPEGFLSGGIQTLIAGHERMKLVQKISAARVALKRSGRLSSADHTLPFAVRYNWETHKFYYDPEEIWKVQEAYRLIDEEGLYNMAEIGRRVGFSRSSVRVILGNKIYIGIRRYDTKRDMNVKRVGLDGRKTYRPRLNCDPDEVIEVTVIENPAVSVERWTRVNRIIEENRTNHVAKLPKEKLVHLCTSYGRCGYCGCTLYLCGNNKRDKATGLRLVWYCCRSHHPGRKGSLPRCNNCYVGEKNLDAV
ncbi:MAG: recombinase family protein, partial [Verrucomicrobiaceae bacterium]